MTRISCLLLCLLATSTNSSPYAFPPGLALLLTVTQDREEEYTFDTMHPSYDEEILACCCDLIRSFSRLQRIASVFEGYLVDDSRHHRRIRIHPYASTQSTRLAGRHEHTHSGPHYGSSLPRSSFQEGFTFESSSNFWGQSRKLRSSL